jgi:hypothetical protein
VDRMGAPARHTEGAHEVAPSTTDGRDEAEAESLAPAVTRAATLLGLLAENAGEPAGPSELARRLGIPKSSVSNICAGLADAGFVRRVGTGFASEWSSRAASRANARTPRGSRTSRPGPRRIGSPAWSTTCAGWRPSYPIRCVAAAEHVRPD